MRSDLTILLPLKGRHHFTLRFFWHANRLRLPYTFLIADADPHPEIVKAINQGLFPHIKIRHLTFPPDSNFFCFFRKMDSAIKYVETPYVMLADNDDFLLGTGIDYAMNFLNCNPDYVACGGAVMGFDVESTFTKGIPVLGNLSLIRQNYNKNYRDYDCSVDDPVERVLRGYGKSSLYYAVARTEVISSIFSDIKKINMSYLPLYEAFYYMRLLSFGKVRIDHSFGSYIRQYSTSFNSSGKDKHRALINSDFSSDLHRVTSVLTDALVPANPKLSADVKNRIYDIYAEKLKSILKRDDDSKNFFSRYRCIMSFRNSVKSIAAAIRGTSTFMQWSTKKYFKSFGASDEYFDIISRELKEIEFILSGVDLKEYLERIKF